MQHIWLGRYQFYFYAMRTTILVTTLYLAGLGLSAPAPISDTRDLQHADGNIVPVVTLDVAGIDYERRGLGKKKTTKAGAASVHPTPTPEPVETTSSVKTTSSSVKTTSSTPTSTSTSVKSTSSSSLVSTSSSSVSRSSSTSSATSSSSVTPTSSSSSSSTLASQSSTKSSSGSSGSTSLTSTGTSLWSTLTSTTVLWSSTSSSNGTAHATSKSRASSTATTTGFSSTLTSSTNGTAHVTSRPQATISSSTASHNGTAHITSAFPSTFSTVTTTATNGTAHSVHTTTSGINGTATGVHTTTAAVNSTATATKCRKSTGTATNTGSLARRTGAADDTAGESCELETVLDFGNGWRTPTDDEYNSATVHTPGAFGSYTFKEYFTKLADGQTGKDDCPNPAITKKYKDMTDDDKKANVAAFEQRTATILTKQFDGGITGAMKSVGKHAAMFYSQVGGHDVERNWVQNTMKKAWRFLPDHWVDGAPTTWLNGAQKCTGIVPAISSGMALLAEGDVHVLLGGIKFKNGEVPVWDKKDPAAQSGKSGNTIWEDWEWPTLLKKNKGACRIWRWNVKTNKSDLLAVRTGAGAAMCQEKYDEKPQGVIKKKYDVPSNAAVPNLVVP